MKRIQLLIPVLACAAALALEPAPAQEVGAGGLRSAGGQEGVAVAPQASTAFAALEMLRMRDGRVLWGEILDHDSKGFSVHRLDTLGRVRLVWSMLEPAQELELQRRYGYVEFEQEELSVDASMIPLRDGTQMIGVIEQSNQDAFVVRTRTGMIVLPRDRVDGAITPTRVPARDIYTRQELYDAERTKFESELASGGSTAVDANLALAAHSERILDYTKAVTHYEAAIALGATDPELAGRLDAAKRRAAAQAQVDALDSIDRLRRQSKFKEAVRELSLFPQLWPASPLIEEWARLNQRVLADRERDMLRLARDRWFYWLSKGARDAAKDMGFEQAMSYAEEGLGQYILAKVTADVQENWPEASQGDVRDLFARRSNWNTRGATYGLGTFLLGKERATALPDKEKDDKEATPLDGLAKQRQELQDRMERFLSSARATSSGASGGSAPQIDPEEFWKTFSVVNRTQWITAFYAEFGRDLEMSRVTLEPHAECGGSGFLEIIASSAGGGVTQRVIPDPACGGVGVKRRVKYK